VAVAHSHSASASAVDGAEDAIVPIEIRRFGVGHRRPGGPIGSVGLSGQVLHSDGRGNVSELAFARNARTEAHANPNTSLFIVVEGGGWVGVDGERTRIAAGEAAVWPADVPHAAWTEHSEMRAFIVEFAGADDRDTVEGRARDAGDDTPVTRGTGQLAARTVRPATPESDEGEPA
jgi:quercetin dioxygenase-like cupin family protein